MLPPLLLSEQGKPSLGQQGSHSHLPGCSTHMEPGPVNSPCGGSPCPKRVGTPSPAVPAHGSGHCSGHASLQPAQRARSCWGFCLAFSFFSFMAGSLLCISNSNRLTQVIIQLPLGLAPAQLGHVSDTWHHARREGDKGIDTLCPKGKQMASINSSGNGDLQELSGIQQVSRRQTPPRVSLRREVVSSPCASSPEQCCGVSPHLLPLSDVPNPPGAQTGARDLRNLPGPLGSLLGGDRHEVGNRGVLLQIGTMQLQGMEMCREKQSRPVAANASFQLQGILCVKQLSGSWDTHTAPTSTVRDHRLGSASLEKGLGLGYLHHILLPRFSSDSGSPLPMVPPSISCNS